MTVDTRPLFSVPDEHAQRIGQAMADAVKLACDDAFAETLALPGDSAERENDALSMVSGVAAMIGVQLVGRLMERKHVGLDAALSVALADITHRIVGTIGAART